MALEHLKSDIGRVINTVLVREMGSVRVRQIRNVLACPHAAFPHLEERGVRG